VRGVCLTPGGFFGRLDPEGSLVRPALFASSVLYLNLILDELLQAVWRLEFNYGLLDAALPGLAVALVLGPLLIAGLSALVLTVLDGAPSRRKFGPVWPLRRHLRRQRGALNKLETRGRRRSRTFGRRATHSPPPGRPNRGIRVAPQSAGRIKRSDPGSHPKVSRHRFTPRNLRYPTKGRPLLGQRFQGERREERRPL
jgi:hypothetical protein